MELLSERIIWARKIYARVSQTELAKACGVTRNAVSLWESGETKSLDSAYLFDAARFLGVNPEWLATGKGSRVLKVEQQPQAYIVQSKDARHKKLLAKFDKLPPKTQLALLELLDSL